ncbi:MAG: hypothetical protein ACI4PF_00820 [Christensenellales bacterium]
MNKLDYDKLDIYVKREKQELIEDCYSKFGWKKLKVQDNARFDDVVDVSFEREHFIPHKDDLQLMQVHMEHYLNDIGVLENRKHAKSCIVGLCAGLFFVAMLIIGILLIAKTATTLSIIGGIIIIAIGLTTLILSNIKIIKIYKRECIEFDKKMTEMQCGLDEICEKAEMLIGDTYENK